MKQVVQNYNSGELRVEDVPAPICRAGGVLVRSAYSLVSTGTEKMKVAQARMSLIQKARARPDKVKQVLQSVRQVGLLETYRKVRERLDALTPLGYSLSGTVAEVGAGLDDFRVGQTVACAGEGIACHAEFVFVPRNLCVGVPESVDLKEAAFATVGAIAMQGVRQAQAGLGDCVLVVGLGLVGLLAVQILKAAGCVVIGVDLSPQHVELAKLCGADAALRRDDPALEDTIRTLSGGRGADVTYIAASTSSSDPMDLAGRMTRDRGTVVIVGIVKVEADWRVYYHKELSVLLSRSYGPGRYDRNYELKGIDYPVGYVRWTQRRNLAEFIRLVSIGAVRPSKLAPQVFKLDEAPSAYAQLNSGDNRRVALLFEYPPDAQATRRIARPAAAQSNGQPLRGGVGIGFVGAGNFATATLIPALKALGDVHLRVICSAGGLSARSTSLRHGFEYAASGFDQVLADERVQAVLIATRHDTHARFAAEALRSGKHVFVEKPLALSQEQLVEVEQAQRQSGKLLMVGYNRRFSPLSVALRDYFGTRTSPVEIQCRVNAGAIGGESWYQDAEEGGWRIVSEGCHWVDLIQFICNAPPVRVYATMIGGDVAGGQNDNCILSLSMADGSIATLMYIANGDPRFEKERIEVFGQGRVGVIDNWMRAQLVGGGKTKLISPAGSGKGHRAEMAAFIAAVRSGGSAPLSLEETLACSRATLAAAESLRTGLPVRCDTHVS